MNDRTLLELLRKIIYKETLYLRHYYGKVVSVTDQINDGKIRVACDQLGMNKGQEIWASPRGKNGILTPAVGDWVEIYFMNGDRNRCVYLGQCLDFDNMLPQSYSGLPTNQVIFEDNGGDFSIVFDELLGSLKIGSNAINGCARLGDSVTVTLSPIDVQLLQLALFSTAGGTQPSPSPFVITGGQIVSASLKTKVE
jgi:hypothetical protein